MRLKGICFQKAESRITRGDYFVKNREIENSRKIRYHERMPLAENYIRELKNRSRKSRVYRKYQLIGLEIAELLEDPGHKSLYIKLAKENGAEKLLRFAKEISQNKNVKNKGAYFMKICQVVKMRPVAAGDKKITKP